MRDSEKEKHCGSWRVICSLYERQWKRKTLWIMEGVSLCQEHCYYLKGNKKHVVWCCKNKPTVSSFTQPAVILCQPILPHTLVQQHAWVRDYYPGVKIQSWLESLHKTWVDRGPIFMYKSVAECPRSPSLRAFWRSRKSPRIDKARLIVSLYQMYQTPSNYWCFQGGKNQFSSNDI